MRIRVNHGIIAKKRPEEGIEVEFTPLVANDYLAHRLESGYLEIIKPNGGPAFLSADKFSELMQANKLAIIEKWMIKESIMNQTNAIKIRYSLSDCIQSLQKANVGKFPKHSISDCIHSIKQMKNGK